MTQIPTSGRRGEPPQEVEIDEALVRRLLASQHPDLADLSLVRVANGWDNCTFRLGEGLAVRLPRREVAARLIEHEQRWLPEIARRVTLPVPAPVRTGVAGEGYPWSFSILPWLEGSSCERLPLDPTEAPALGHFLAELHTEAPAVAPPNPFRGVPLEERQASFEERFASLRRHADDLDHAALSRLWEEALAAPVETERLWLHGDLHPKNVIGREGKLAAVIDWGDLTAGDPATDLASAWMLFPVETHDALFGAYGKLTPERLVRARGWAVLLGMVFLDAGLVSDPVFARLGRRVLERVCTHSDPD